MTRIARFVSALLLGCTVSAPALAVDQATMQWAVDRTWTGMSVQAANFTQDGQVRLEQKFDLDVSGDRVSGTATTKMTLDGVSYSVVSNVSGTLSAWNDSLTLNDAGRVWADPLPYGLQWCSGNGTYTVYQDEANPGKLLLKGTISDSCGGTSQVELSG
jgi:hypothetical protein